MYIFYIFICLASTVVLLAVVAFYVLAFRRYKHVPYRIGLTVWLLPFIVLMFFALLNLWIWNEIPYGRNFVKSLPLIKLFRNSWQNADPIVLILTYFAVWGMMAFIISLLIEFILDIIKQGKR
jgi:Na+/melibiose symporter-like transporter